jgi:hypothetical protein
MGVSVGAAITPWIPGAIVQLAGIDVILFILFRSPQLCPRLLDKAQARITARGSIVALPLYHILQRATD